MTVTQLAAKMFVNRVLPLTLTFECRQAASEPLNRLYFGQGAARFNRFGEYLLAQLQLLRQHLAVLVRNEIVSAV